jgi:MFS family permease
MTATSTTTQAPEAAPPSRWTLPIILTAQFVTPMSIAGTAIALPKISTDLGAQTTALQWVVNGFNVAFALGVLAFGALSDRIGYRRTFTIGGIVFATASLISAVSPSLILLDAMRVIAGLGAAAVLTGASSMLSNAFEGSARARAFALFGTMNGLGLALGPTISGALVTSVGWRGVFAVHGLILAIVALGSRVLPSASAPAAQAVTTTDAETRTPLLDLSLLRNREFLAMCLVPMAGSIGFVTLLTYLPSAFSGIRDLSAGQSGLLMLAMTVPVVIAPTIGARLIDTVSSITVGSVIYTSLLALILGDLGLMLLDENRSLAWIIVPMILLGFGFGLPIGLVDGHALEVVPPERTGTAAGLLNFFRVGSEAVFVAGYSLVLSTLIGQKLTGDAATDTAAGQPGHPDVYTSAFTTTTLILAVLVTVITVAVLAIRRNRTATHGTIPPS